LGAINMSGKLHMVPALLNDQYVIRFVICAQNACDDDILFAWNVICEMAVDVLEVRRTRNENNVLKTDEKLESLDLTEEDDEGITDTPSVLTPSPAIVEKPETKHEVELNDVMDEDGVFLYDNKPSIPSSSTSYEENQRPTTSKENFLLRMISDPKCYIARVLKSMYSDTKRQRCDSDG